MSDLDEGRLQDKAEKGAEKYLRSSEYKPFLESLDKSPLSKARSITEYDYYALGSQLEAFDTYKNMCEEDGTIAQLGKIPNIAYDIITVNYGSSPMSVIASTQPVDEEQGTVYYKDVVASTTRGSHTAGDTIFQPDQGGQTPLAGYAQDTITEDLGDTAATVLQYNLNITNAPIRPYCTTITIPTINDTVSGQPLKAVDNGEGYLVGIEINGTIDYETGAVVLNVANDPAGVHAISATSAQNFEAAADIPTINMVLRSKTIKGKIWALKDTVGIEQSYALRRRFGLVAEDEITNDLVAAINSEMMNAGIAQLNAKAVGNVNFTKAAPANVSDFEHRQSFKFKLAEAESTLLGNAGRGTINVLITGLNGASIISTLPGFVKVSDGTSIGPHIYGTLDGMTVIRVQNTNILDADSILAVYKGTSPFDASLVWAPYMPLVVTSALPTGTNPLTNQKAAAIWGGLEVLTERFVTKITLV